MRSNSELVGYLLEHGYADLRVAEAMERVDRKAFVPPEFWQSAYEDIPIPIQHNQTISAPSVVAIMTRELDVRKGMKVLEVGTGSGYQAAVLAELIGESGRLVTVEIVPELAERARSNLAPFGFRNIKVVNADGSKGYAPEAPYDRIIVTAAAPRVPPPLREQLKDGGKLIIPIGSAYWQDLVVIERKGEKFEERPVLQVMFVPLIGEHGFKSGMESQR